MGNGDDILHVQIGLSIIGIVGRLWQIRRAIFRIDKDDRKARERCQSWTRRE
jgi:hypothetical protein